MAPHDFLPEPFLRGVYGTGPFLDYCRRRGIPFEQDAGRPLPADGLARWTSALAELTRERHAGVELELGKVHALAGEKASALLLEASEPEDLPPDDVPVGAPLALWFLLNQPEFFHEAFLRHEDRTEATWRTERATPVLALGDLEAKAKALETELQDVFRRGNTQAPACAVSAHRLAQSSCFTATVTDRLRFSQMFSDAGQVAMRPVRPALPVTFAYYPACGTVLLGSPLRPGDRAEELLRRASLAVLGHAPDPDKAAYDLEPLKGPFRPLPDSQDMESVRVRTLHLRYPARLGRRRLTLETHPGDGPQAIEEMLRIHATAGPLDELRVSYAELQIRLRAAGGVRNLIVRLWPDRSNLGPTPQGDRLRACLRRWGLCHGE